MRARYSASTKEHDTVVCFLDFHEIKGSPRNTQKPVMDLRESGQMVQSALEKARNYEDEEAEKKDSHLEVGTIIFLYLIKTYDFQHMK